ncbi:MAG: carotenoid oxygenase family protein, partial [Cyanobacteria bacterium P01_G01_bin.19]
RDGKNKPIENLPPELHGHMFVVSPAGSPESAPVAGGNRVVWVTKDGWTPIFNGDGLVYRVSFEAGKSYLKTSFLKPPCYYADRATTNNDYYEPLAFQDLGISRISLNKLGARNQLNTAFLTFKLPGQSDRLLVTWDVGRPYEIDPETLETLTPVGKNDDWSNLLRSVPVYPFKQTMSSAHPVADPQTGEVFTVNIGKSIWTMLALPRSIKERWESNTKALSSTIDNSNLPESIRKIFSRLYSIFLWLVKFGVGVASIVEKIFRFIGGGYDFVHLIAWDGKKVDIAGKWHVILPNKRSIKIDQTIHQIGLTKKYLVLAETSFKFSMENLLPYQRDLLATDLKVLLADFLDYPQSPETKLYIIKREDLNNAKLKGNKFLRWISRSPSKNVPKVVAKEVKIAPEFSHFLVDYDDEGDRIVAHISHLSGTDVAEYIRIIDRSVFDDRDLNNHQYTYDDPDMTARLHKLAGNLVGPMDVSRLGRWVIDAENAKVVGEPQTVCDRDLTWSTAFYACLDPKSTDKYTDIFWNNWGCWAETFTERNVAAYQNYDSLIPWQDVLDIAYEGIPSSICHVKIREDAQGNTTIEIDPKNFYKFPKNHLGTSAQFIPRPDAKNQTDGYIAAIVLTSDEFLSQANPDDNSSWSQNSEIWIFEADKLDKGVKYKLSHPKLNIGFTTHTTWLAKAVSPQKLEYSVEKDHQHLVQQLIDKEKEEELKSKIRKLFDEEIYPKFQEEDD